MLKRICFCLLIFVSLASTAQEVSSYEIEKDYPVFLDQIKQELTYPMAWGNSPLKDFPIWRKTRSCYCIGSHVNSASCCQQI